MVFDLSRAKLPASIMNSYLKAIEFPSYARSISSSVAQFRPFIQFCKRPGIGKDLIAAFITNTDIARLGRANPKTKLNNIRNLVEDARYCGVSDAHLATLTDELDWFAIGKSHGIMPRGVGCTCSTSCLATTALGQPTR